jgi:hypothetical protein
MLKEQLSAFVDYDKQSKMIRTKPEYAERFKRLKANHDLVWYNVKEDSQFKQMIEEKSPKSDPLEMPDCSSLLNKRLQAKIYDEETLKRALDVASQFESMKDSANLVRAFLKFIIMTLSSYNQQTHSEKFLKEFLNEKLDALLHRFEKKQSLEGLVSSAREKIDVLRKKYLLDGHSPSSLPKVQMSQATEEDRKAHIKKIYEAKIAKIMAKMNARKKRFMEGLDIASDMMVQSISKTDSDIQCPITQEQLTNQKLYFMLGQMHFYNVGSANPRLGTWPRSSP